MFAAERYGVHWRGFALWWFGRGFFIGRVGPARVVTHAGTRIISARAAICRAVNACQMSLGIRAMMASHVRGYRAHPCGSRQDIRAALFRFMFMVSCSKIAFFCIILI